jgi:DNA repair protein RadD
VLPEHLDGHFAGGLLLADCTLMKLQLRPYQQAAVDAITKFFVGNPTGNPVIELPTSAGKSLIQADFITSVMQQWPGQRILCLAHVKELVSQNHAELMGYWPGAPSGINSAQMGRRDLSDPILFAMIQSVYKKPAALGWRDLVIIDECHLVPVKTSDGMYRKLIDGLRAMNPALKVIGLSATPYRLDNGYLNEGENALFTDVIPAKAFNASIPSLLEQNFLTPVRTPGRDLRTKIDVSGVKKTAGDYNMKQLAAAVDVDEVTRGAVREVVAFGQDRKSWLLFATSVAHAHNIAAELADYDIDSEVVTAKTTPEIRSDIIQRFKQGQLRCLVNVNCLTTGFNAPGVDLLGFLRPTHSVNLYVQMVGRGMRLATGKTDCLVLDFAGLIEKHGPVDQVKVKRKRKSLDGDAPVKDCPKCYFLIHASASACPYCGHEFPVDTTPDIDATATDKSILTLAEISARSKIPIRYDVDEVRFSEHLKPGKPPSIKVTYRCGMQLFFEWVCIYHEGFAGKNGASWWRENVGGPIPSDLGAALEQCENWAQRPTYIYVDRSSDFKKITSRGFDAREGNGTTG